MPESTNHTDLLYRDNAKVTPEEGERPSEAVLPAIADPVAVDEVAEVLVPELIP